jgi:hypothetical protein
VALTFHYKSKLGGRGIVPVPILPVTFTNPATGDRIDVDCLIDSGADDTLINAKLAGLLGIAVTAGTRRLYQGIAHAPIPAYDHTVLMQIANDTHQFAITAAFMPELRTACLLGRHGFFEHYKVVFEQYKDRFAITPIVP